MYLKEAGKAWRKRSQDDHRNCHKLISFNPHSLFARYEKLCLWPGLSRLSETERWHCLSSVKCPPDASPLTKAPLKTTTTQTNLSQMLAMLTGPLVMTEWRRQRQTCYIGNKYNLLNLNVFSGMALSVDGLICGFVQTIL